MSFAHPFSPERDRARETETPMDSMAMPRNPMVCVYVYLCILIITIVVNLICNSCQSAWYNHVYSQLTADAFPVNAPS